MDEQGYDLNLKIDLPLGQFRWNFLFNLSKATNKIIKYDGPFLRANTVVLSSGSVLRPIEGMPAFPVFAYRSAGLDPENGDPRGFFKGAVSKDYAAIFQDSVQNTQFLGSAQPPYFGTIRNTLKWKDGKITHSRLWLEAFPKAELLNDNNPAIRIHPDGKCFIYGTPWSGKTACYKAMKVELGGIVRLLQFKENRFERLEGMKAFLALLPSCTGIRWHSELFRRMNDLVEGIVNNVPIGFLRCLANVYAATVCRKGFLLNR